jgi:hypothetical protein
MGLMHFNGVPAAITGSGKPIKKWFAAVLLAGIGFPLQFKYISSGMPISASSIKQDAYCQYKLQNLFPARNAGKIISCECEGALRYQFAAYTRWI